MSQPIPFAELFDHSPLSLWVEDFSEVRRLLEQARAAGVADLHAHMARDPGFAQRCMRAVRVIDVNRRTLRLFRAPSKRVLIERIHEVLCEETAPCFAGQLLELWAGRLQHAGETVNHTLEGDRLHMHLEFSVLPGHESTWALAQVSLTDITARKRAEAKLEFMGRHDALTQLRNRSFFVEEIRRLEHDGPFPVAVLMIDLNGLKPINDTWGHAHGDALLRRTGEVLRQAAGSLHHAHCAAVRLGGDEFAMLMPGTDEAGGAMMADHVRSLVLADNRLHADLPLSLATGIAICQAGGSMESAIHEADERMYAEKKKFYASGNERRRQPI